MRRFLSICLVLLASVLSFATSLNMTVNTDKSTCHVGDPVTISARAVVKEGSVVTFAFVKPQVTVDEDNTESLPVWEKGITTDEKLPDGYHLYRYSITVHPFQLGTLSLGKIKATAGGDTVEKKVPDVEVVSMFAGGKEKKTINPLKPQLEIKPDYSHLIRVVAVVLGGLLLLALLVFVIFRMLKRYRNRDRLAIEKKLPKIPPCEEVRELLGKLLASRYLKDGRIKDFYVELAEIGKRFLGRAFGLEYSVETSEEMLNNLAGHTTVDEDRLVREFLDACDMVKFAKLVPAQGETNSHVNLVYKLADLICQRQEEEKEKAESGEESNVSV
ncbi:MAG: hypothetical protein DRJ14_01130 [Acidobacteria bacterium]|nr:MAG: hypothetical protein DRJ14_01130 [Acidobacteriota bacterium]